MDYNGTPSNDLIDQQKLKLGDWINIYGRGGNDTVIIDKATYTIGGPGNNTITGLSTYSGVAYWNSPGPVQIDLVKGFAQNGFGGIDTLNNIQTIQASKISETTIIGSLKPEQFYVFSTPTTISGGGGRDIVNYYNQKSTDFQYSYDSITDTLTVNKKINGVVQSDKLTGIPIISFIGPESDNFSFSPMDLVTTDMKIGGFTKAYTTSFYDAKTIGYTTDTWNTGDFNNDGNVDIVVFRLNWTTNPNAPIQILVGDGKGNFTDGTKNIFKNSVPITNYVARSLIADFNNDGASDILAIDSGIDVQPFSGGQNKLYLSDGNGQLIDQTNKLPQLVTQNHGGAVGDINNDGLLDYLNSPLNPTASSSTDPQLQDNTGKFISTPTIAPVNVQPNIFGSGTMASTSPWSSLIDINVDGYLDAILGTWGQNDYPVRVFLNDGSGNYSKSKPIDLPKVGLYKESTMQIKPIDLNGDIFPDLALSVVNGGDMLTESTQFYNIPYIQLLVNDGAGGFLDETSTRLSQSKIPDSLPNWYKYINITDINADGYSDIVAIGDGTNNPGVTVFLNNGKGNFSKLFTSSYTSGFGTVADFNNDGLPDLLSSNSDASKATVWINSNENHHIYKANYGGDNLFGSKGNDKFYPGDGFDLINGNGGIDSLNIASKKDQFKLTHTNDTWTIVKNNKKTEKIEAINISRIIFSDVSLATDINGNAGKVVKLLGAVFGKDAAMNKDYVGIGLDLLDKGMSYDTLAGVALGAAKATTNDQIVTTLWTNVVGSTPLTADKAPFIRMLEGGMSPGALAQLAADTSLNTTNINLIGLAQTGIEYTPVV